MPQAAKSRARAPAAAAATSRYHAITRLDISPATKDVRAALIAVSGEPASPVDIVHVDCLLQPLLRVRHAVAATLLRRNIYFEIHYAQIFDNPSLFIANAKSLFRVTNGRNIIIVPGTPDRLKHRGAADLVNLFSLFAPRHVVKHCIVDNVAAVLRKAEMRAHVHRSVLRVMDYAKLSKFEREFAGDDDDPEDDDGQSSGAEDEQMDFIQL